MEQDQHSHLPSVDGFSSLNLSYTPKIEDYSLSMLLHIEGTKKKTKKKNEKIYTPPPPFQNAVETQQIGGVKNQDKNSVLQKTVTPACQVT